MNKDSIAFPNLHIVLQHVGKNFTIGGFSIAYYGCVIGLGMIVAMIFILHEARRLGYKQDDFVDMFIWGLIFGVIGARLYYVIFSWDLYKDNLLSIFNLRNGGLAIYGGIIAGTITVIVVCRIKKFPFLKAADVIVFGVLIGQIFGRWGNFFNREAFGGYTDNLLAMQIPTEACRSMDDITQEMLDHATEINGLTFVQVHPTFLYESLWNLGVFLFLLWYRKRHKHFDGEIFAMYMGFYGLGRMWIEGLRTDQLRIPGTPIPVSQLLAAVLFAASLIWLWWGNYRKMLRKSIDEKDSADTGGSDNDGTDKS